MRSVRRLMVARMGAGVLALVVAMGVPGAVSAAVVPWFELDGAFSEQPVDEFAALLTGEKPTVFRELLARLDRARRDDNVPAVVLRIEMPALGSAQIEELQRSIRALKEAGKPVYAISQMHTNSSYLLASACSQVYMVPTGMLMLYGMEADLLYLRGTLEKLGITAEMEHIGAYKSAAESLTRTGPSPEAEENVNWLLDGLYEHFVRTIAEGRGLSEHRVRELIDEGPYTCDQALEAGLIDAIGYVADLKQVLKDNYGEDVQFDRKYGEKDRPKLDTSNPFAFFAYLQQMMSRVAAEPEPAVGVVYVEGMIVPGKSEDDPLLGRTAGDETLRKALEKARRDENIKAVVLRVDSPGGSGLASEVILEATRRLAAEKPFVVSMGNVAGSGGYYVSLGTETIFADETTITASIGVIGGKLVTGGLWDKIGVTWHSVKRGKNADIFNGRKPFTPQQREKLVSMLRDFYEVFTSRVERARGEKLSRDIEEVAGGRVFTGRQALELGLVDRIGGLREAIAYAGEQAGLEPPYKVRVFPEPKTFLERILEEMMGGDEDENLVRVPGVSPLRSVVRDLALVDEDLARAAGRLLRRAWLLQREGVILAMPMEIVVR